jgi:hypothetical protein
VAGGTGGTTAAQARTNLGITSADLLPDETATHDLGSASYAWSQLYLSSDITFTGAALVRAGTTLTLSGDWDDDSEPFSGRVVIANNNTGYIQFVDYVGSASMDFGIGLATGGGAIGAIGYDKTSENWTFNPSDGAGGFAGADNFVWNSGASAWQFNGDLSLNSGCAFTISTGNVRALNLPTSDPGVVGRLWNDGGTLKISAG